MKREIKFRAWDEQANAWNKKYSTAVGGEHSPLREMYDWEALKEYSMDALECDSQFEIMQFTGLKDKNGVDIYEGDIVPCKVGIRQYSGWVVGDPDARLNGIVEWNPHQSCWHIVFKQPNEYNVISIQLGWGGNPELEVIGNIYENPEPLTH